jgi:hypothetical protein
MEEKMSAKISKISSLANLEVSSKINIASAKKITLLLS